MGKLKDKVAAAREEALAEGPTKAGGTGGGRGVEAAAARAEKSGPRPWRRPAPPRHQTAEAAAATGLDLEKKLAFAADGAKEQAVAAALSEVSADREKALSEAAKRVKALEDALAAAGDLFQNEKREALEDLTQKHESVFWRRRNAK